MTRTLLASISLAAFACTSAPGEPTTSGPREVTVFGTASPLTAEGPSGSPVELGLKLRPQVAGHVTAIRYFSASGRPAGDVATLWSAAGKVLAQVALPEGAPPGWREVRLPQAIEVAAGEVYTASYWAADGRFAYSDSGAPNGLMAEGLSTIGAAYAYVASPSLPSAAFPKVNYWVDVAFVPGAGPSLNAEGKAVELGMKFRSERAGEISAIRFYRLDAVPQPITVSLWSAEGQLLAQEKATSNGSGWQEVRLSAPVSIKAATDYVASYHVERGAFWYLERALRDPLRNGDITAVAELYTYQPVPAFPFNSNFDHNYLTDVVFTPAPRDKPQTLFERIVR